MSAPSTLKVIIEGRDTEEIAKLVQYSQRYHSGEYETDDGTRFFVDSAYIAELSGKPAKIPSEVIRQLANMRAKLAEGQAVLNRQAREKDSKIILPPSYD